MGDFQTSPSVRPVTTWALALLIITWSVDVLPTTTTASAQDNGKQQDGQGKYAELTARWSQWVLEQPVTGNPAFDETGADAANGQENGIGPANKYFFLAGVFNVSGTAERTITVPAGKALFFPVLDTEFDNSNTPTPAGNLPGNYSVPELRALAASTVATTTELHVTLDGVSLLDRVARVKSPSFRYILPTKDNIAQFFGFDFSGPIHPAVADGFWLVIPPLAPGEHVLNFGGTFGSPINFTLDITYHITVQ
jgi:hypothetical protein